MKTILRIILILAFLGGMCFIPAIPLLRVSLIPQIPSEITNLSLVELLPMLRNPIVPPALTWEWYSYLASALLLAIMVSVPLLIARIRL
jgi:hypothetical protein